MAGACRGFSITFAQEDSALGDGQMSSRQDRNANASLQLLQRYSRCPWVMLTEAPTWVCRALGSSTAVNGTHWLGPCLLLLGHVGSSLACWAKEELGSLWISSCPWPDLLHTGFSVPAQSCHCVQLRPGSGPSPQVTSNFHTWISFPTALSILIIFSFWAPGLDLFSQVYSYFSGPGTWSCLPVSENG